MKQSVRLFYCIRCRMPVTVCSDCDRGQIYCGQACASKARVHACREAEKRYQQTFKGRLKHAARQQRYRAKIKKVTDQGSQLYPRNDLLNAVDNEPKPVKTGLKDYLKRCCFCHKPVTPLFRQGFLRHATTLVAKDWPLCRSP